ncbi:serine peptidase [Colletotrichum camelliae]|nr:serine peptidase [Colletotrichum camelliae]
MRNSLFAIAAVLAAATSATFSLQDLDLRHNQQSLRAEDGSEKDATLATFTQLIDHTDPTKGHFEQRYWDNAKFWGGPGYPVFMVSTGENNAEGSTWMLSNGSLAHLYGEKFQGAIVPFEHRYYGKSQPFKTMTAETLQYHTVPQSLQDNKHFAQTVKFSFDKCGGANADKSPWVLIGGSYAGALAAWQSVITPGVFAAHHASYAVVHAIEDFWQFWTLIEQAMPRTCSYGVKLVIDKVDSILSKGDTQEIAAMKNEFGVASLDDFDFARMPIKVLPDDFYDVSEFCNDTGKRLNNGTPNKGQHEPDVVLDVAWNMYANLTQSYWKDFCTEAPCDWEHEKEIEFPSSPKNLGAARSWTWQLCNELGWWQIGPPQSDGSNIVSSYLTSDPMSQGATADDFNKWTKGGWNAPFEKVMFVDGEFDMWNSATMSSVYRPGGPWKSTEKVPRMVVKRGLHVPDLDLDHVNWDVFEGLAVVTKKQLKIMEKWLSEWKPKHS